MVKGIFFDIDGTLLTEWPLIMTILPQVYRDISKKLNVPIYKAREIFLQEIEKRRGTYEWHDWNFFFKMFELPYRFEDFIEKYPHKIELYPGTIELLEDLSKRYVLGIITSGPKYQRKKLEVTGIIEYFDVIITRDDVKTVKPDPKIFIAALEKARIKPREAVMVGDNLEQDILGAIALGMKGIWINKNGETNFNVPYLNVRSISEVRKAMEVLENEEDI
ncbi:TIGR02253 family HAD-type hydrolase [Pyrococcus kukulkanii]|uniref:TIGR02253 family HAD-type hydrolase n=1 Tax=Pyrococcus kukulkanii TaxID=1609559 RepID=UPI0035645337